MFDKKSSIFFPLFSFEVVFEEKSAHFVQENTIQNN